ncbi:eukaryotic translation initiation factor 2 gamma, putative [Trypanosoma equiperdum]|uniref:protein-synthesizing GTPase n=4 Tax=Trypanozoon TaxID=39700 RepID=Q382L1_TRYB2|nr:eukaryotic translation initiation factor 2 gamma,putative [Trypanosoma brucei gambiense DAL972]XP_829382.1 eukaryotic translation initiation factor 2 gamma, putative [Trypanosoma brucei brucei TREU927]RHW67898.1 eukaryotic translation initiation factor 2 gamma [Trypanosoma brucei equiperdum]SCU66309.1 eukaryotic translation initiation factor 2 gamma, putative [Trypanosoma equiperdum]EAN80270.1 eukaryotic translation initiation factor 2 gamma, putative [Trypanosoma brucei brucei TREU927]CBH1|eukprot:XP_011780624.1 eukaryotic translation initiation factor 2 gamma,putative [Trypanosoma brucei gambiense DAL972]
MSENDIADFTIDETTLSSDPTRDCGLAAQNLSAMDLDKMSVETFEVMSRQATINIGTIGHVAHGKSTVVKALSGVKTQKYHREAVMNITIHLGYANAKVFRCDSCPVPAAYHAFPSSQPDKTGCPTCGAPLTLKRHFSFVDCPGHDVLMATMLNGAAIMDAALLLIAANEPFPQPQTLEHLKAVEIMKLRNLIILQNKIDLVGEVHAQDQYHKIRDYIDSTIGLSAPIIPISAQLKRNVDYLLEYLCRMPLPTRQLNCPARMTVVRSFDINKPGEVDIETLRGGVAGGTVIQGVLRVNQIVEIRPGQVHTQTGGTFSCTPLRTRALTLKAEDNSLQYAIPGGLIAVGTTLDPTLTRQDKMVGHMIGEEGSLPQVYAEIEVQYYLFSEMVGQSKQRDRNAKRVQKLNVQETLQINVGTLTAGATVVSITKSPDIAKLTLVTPVCCTMDEQIAISRLVEKNFRLIGWGTIRRGVPVKLN